MKLNWRIASAVRVRAMELLLKRNAGSWREAEDIAVREVASAEKRKAANLPPRPQYRARTKEEAELWELLSRPLPTVDLRPAHQRPDDDRIQTTPVEQPRRSPVRVLRKAPAPQTRKRGPLLYTAGATASVVLNGEFRDDEATSNWRMQQRDRS